MQTYPPELQPHPETVDLALRLRREIAPLQNGLGKSEDMEDYYQAIDWFRDNCAFTPTGDVVFHGGDKTAEHPVPVRLYFVKKRDPLYRLVQSEAERNGTKVNKEVFTNPE